MLILCLVLYTKPDETSHVFNLFHFGWLHTVRKLFVKIYAMVLQPPESITVNPSFTV